MILVEADVSGEWDSKEGWEALAGEAVRAAVAESGWAKLLESELAVEVSVRFTGDEEVRKLNADWRGKDKPTNVLSFPMFEAAVLPSLGELQGGEVLLGDVALAYGVCAREAGEKAIPLRHHAAHLIVHGTLHLLGHEHEGDESKADEMESAERRALAALGVGDPYEVHQG